MVEGRTLSATVVDLDGTLVGCNTLVEFAKFTLREAARRWRIADACGLLFWMGVRQTRLVGHRRMKYNILRVASRFLSPADVGRFADKAERWVNIDVVDRMADEMVVLATAAPRFYAEPMARRLGIAHVVATEFPFPAASAEERGRASSPEGRESLVFSDFVECKGEEKLRRVEQLLAANSAELVAVVTDHHDDLPLLLANPTKRNILVAPSKRTRSILTSHRVPFTVI